MTNLTFYLLLFIFADARSDKQTVLQTIASMPTFIFTKSLFQDMIRISVFHHDSKPNHIRHD